MPLLPNMEPSEYLDILRRRKWLVIFSIVLVMLGAAAYCVAVPDVYRSTATILVIPPTVPEQYVGPITKDKIHERIPALGYQVLSRNRLRQVMDELGLYVEERKKTSVDGLVAWMQKQIQIKVLRGKDAFDLSFEHENPRIAMQTVSKLSSLFIDENIRARELQAAATSEFLDTQLNETKAKLEAQEEKLKRYKLQYTGELPQEMQANLSMMNRIQDQLRNNGDAIARSEDRKMFLESKIGDLQKEIATIESQGVEPGDPVDKLLAEIDVRQRKIRELTLKYTSRYPTVVQLQGEVKELKQKIEGLRGTGPLPIDPAGEDLATKEPEHRKAVAQRKEVRHLREQVERLDLEISSLKKESAQSRNMIDKIQERVGRLPQREQEMISLTRDYDNLKRSYDGLLAKKLGAKVSQNLEEDQMGETFQVIDPPNLPSAPYKPDRLKILGLAFLAAIALGCGGAIAREMLDPTLKGPKDFKFFFEIPVLASLPVLPANGTGRLARNARTMVLIGLCSVLSAVTVILLVYRDHIRAVLQTTGGIGS